PNWTVRRTGFLAWVIGMVDRGPAPPGCAIGTVGALLFGGGGGIGSTSTSPNASVLFRIGFALAVVGRLSTAIGRWRSPHSPPLGPANAGSSLISRSSSPLAPTGEGRSTMRSSSPKFGAVWPGGRGAAGAGGSGAPKPIGTVPRPRVGGGGAGGKGFAPGGG